MARAFPSVVIENLQPLIDGGRYPIKRIVGEDLVVEADIFKDGHDVVAAILKWRVLGKRAGRETPMNFVDNDRWRGICTLYDEDITNTRSRHGQTIFGVGRRSSQEI
jgi:starch synthase (maltosyl-transferring)